VGSTALSARLDPEDLRSVIGAYHRCCAAVIERASGFVAKYMGDGVLAYLAGLARHQRRPRRAGGRHTLAPNRQDRAPRVARDGAHLLSADFP
jgi:class 3 adenylate cyclase